MSENTKQFVAFCIAAVLVIGGMTHCAARSNDNKAAAHKALH